MLSTFTAPTAGRHLTAALLLTLGLSPAVLAQQADSTRVSASFDKAPLEQVVRTLEGQTSYRFYFDPAIVDTVKLSVRAEQLTVPTLLRRALAGHDLHYAVDAQHRVFITSGRPIELGLSPRYFAPDEEERTAAGGPGEDPLETLNAPKAKQNSPTRVYGIGGGAAARGETRATVGGYVRDQANGQPIVGATVVAEASKVGASTDQFGYFSLTLPLGRHSLLVRSIGVKNTRRQINLQGDGKLDIEVEEDVTRLREVVIEAEKDKNVAGMQMGLEKLDIKTIRQVPTAFGEADILRVVLTLPGVKSVGEGSTGMNVRGGASDQNLILFNDATIYNPAHLFGFFSAFNPDILQGVELYKSAVPAKYGGRLSSVLDITTREGNRKKFSGAGGIGPLTSRLTLEGPILKDKASFIVSGRTSYSDWILHQLPDRGYRESSASFYDLSAHFGYDINDKNAVYATGYISRDKFRLGSDTTYQYQNRNLSVKWKHVFGPKLYAVLTGASSHYDYAVTSERNPVSASTLTYGLNQTNGQLDFSYFLSPKHTVEFGLSSIRYNVEPGALRARGDQSLVTPLVLAKEQAQESAIYASDRIDLNAHLSVSVGLRYSLFNALGPANVRQYAPGQPRNEGTVVDTVRYGKGSNLATYHGPEYRLSARYALTVNSSVKASYNRTRQYIHMLSNTASMSPTDVWKLSDYHIRPQVGDQVALGFYHNFKNNTIETSVEGYYKKMHDFVDYKSGATLILNQHIETDIVNAEGKAYGVEVMVKKLSGKLNGWVSYTYSRSLVRVNSGTPSERINGGSYYPSNFDKPHDVTMIGNYRFNRRLSTSLNVTYSTGRPITLPLAKYYIGNAYRVLYSDRNAYRVPDYFRADLALNIEGNHKIKKLAHGFWTVGVYNLTGRKNPYSIYFKTENGAIRGYKLSIFGQPIPTVTYNFKF